MSPRCCCLALCPAPCEAVVSPTVCVCPVPPVARHQALASRAQPGPSGAGRLLVEELPGLDPKALQEAATALLAGLPEPAAVLLASSPEPAGPGQEPGKVSFVAALSPQVRRRWQWPRAAACCV